MAELNGVWRTISGRKVFIKTGQSLSEAMKESSKFTNVKSNGLGSDNDNSTEEHLSPQLLETIDITDNKKVEETLKKYENKIKDDKIENAIVITTDGEVYQCFGVKNRVFPDKDLGDKLYNAYVTHNHPKDVTNYSFSSDDINIFEKYNLSRLRGVDYKYSYELDRSKKATIKMPTFGDIIEDNSFNHLKAIEYSIDNDIFYERQRNE